jgi:hypothetical protein
MGLYGYYNVNSKREMPVQDLESEGQVKDHPKKQEQHSLT